MRPRAVAARFRIQCDDGYAGLSSEFSPVSRASVSRVSEVRLRVLVVSNQKGGVGKTTTAISLGAALVERGQRVLIVDLDPQANATSGLGIAKDRAGTYGVLLKERPITESIVNTVVPGLDLLPSGHEMAGAEVELVPLMAREFRLRHALRAAAGYDTVIVDCEGGEIAITKQETPELAETST